MREAEKDAAKRSTRALADDEINREKREVDAVLDG